MTFFPAETTDLTLQEAQRLNHYVNGTFKNNQTQGFQELKEKYVSRMFCQREKEGMEEQYRGI